MIDDAPLLLVCESIHDVLAAEKVLKQRGLWCDLVPTPREISSDCGMSLACRREELPVVRLLVEDEEVLGCRLHGADGT